EDITRSTHPSYDMDSQFTHFTIKQIGPIDPSIVMIVQDIIICQSDKPNYGYHLPDTWKFPTSLTASCLRGTSSGHLMTSTESEKTPSCTLRWLSTIVSDQSNSNRIHFK